MSVDVGTGVERNDIAVAWTISLPKSCHPFQRSMAHRRCRMRRPLVRVSPSRNYCKHSRISVTLEVSQPLSSLELARLAQTLRRWTGQAARVALCAGEELGWLEEWAETLDGARGQLVEVDFLTSMRCGCGPREGEPF
jgi:hypothetical protein